MAGLPQLEDGKGAPDVVDAELADVALMWRNVELESRMRGHRRARTSVTSLRSSGVTWPGLPADIECCCQCYDLSECVLIPAGLIECSLERDKLLRSHAVCV